MKKTLWKRIVPAVCAWMLCVSLCPLGMLEAAAARGTPTWTLIDTSDLSNGTFVAAYDLTADYGAARSGSAAAPAPADCTALLQEAIDSLNALGGGTIYLPAGVYNVAGSIRLKRGVTLRGDWTEPVAGEPLDVTKNTLIRTNFGRNATNLVAPGFINMEPETGVIDLSFWYPEQSAQAIAPYAPTLVMGVQGYFGNEYCSVKNVTMVNAYTAFQFNYSSGGASPVVNGLYGTPLKMGVEIDGLGDVGRIERLRFAPAYWIGSGLPGAPESGGAMTAVKDFVYQNGIGLSIRRIDWSYMCYLDIRGYNVGIYARASLTNSGGEPNGQVYDMLFKDCETGLRIKASSTAGLMFTKLRAENCEDGIYMESTCANTIQVTAADIDAERYAVRVEGGTLLFNQGTVRRGHVYVKNGVFDGSSTAFNNDAPQITFGITGRGILTNNTYQYAFACADKSMYDHILNPAADAGLFGEPLADFPEQKQEAKAPARMALYNVASAPYNAQRTMYNGLSAQRALTNADSTAIIQRALDDAADDGGGIVFLPSGRYRINGHLNIPSGVELRGACGETSSIPHGTGSILEAFPDRDNPDGAPLITMQEDSGLRGIVINYPDQKITNITADGKLDAKPYPYAIQGRGDNIYMINIGLRAVWNGVDLFTYKCDNIYLDFVCGQVFKNALRIGAGAENGTIKNIMANVIVYACGYETKFGPWANSADGNKSVNGTTYNGLSYTHSWENLVFMIVGDCSGMRFYNNFHYGSQSGLRLVSDGNGGPQDMLNMGLGIDGSRQSMYYDTGLTGRIDFINTQVVASDGAKNSLSSYITTAPDSAVNSSFWGMMLWGSPHNAFNIGADSGTVNLMTINMYASGTNRFVAAAAGTNRLNVINSYLKGTMSTTSEPENVRITASLTNGNVPGADMRYSSTQSLAPNYSKMAAAGVRERTDWVASASVNNSAAGNALNGNASSRWTTNRAMAAGDWFQVDTTDAAKTYDALFLDVGSSSNDYPRAYAVYVTDDLADWASADRAGWGVPVATGSGPGVISFSPQTARYIRIVLTSVSGSVGYWSIHGFYLADSLLADQLHVIFPNAMDSYSVEAQDGSVSPVPDGGSYAFKVVPHAGYAAVGGVTVTANGAPLTPDGNGVYTVSDITQNVTVLIDALWEEILTHVQYGDVNGDGNVDSTDARMVLQYEVKLITLDEDQQYAADVNGDGEADSSDARMILQYEVKLISW